LYAKKYKAYNIVINKSTQIENMEYLTLKMLDFFLK